MWNGISRTGDRGAGVEHALWVLAAALVPIYATWWAWFGGVSFGPRFFVVAAIPAAMATADVVCRSDRSLLRSAVAVLSVVLTSWVCISGAIFGVTSTAFDWCAAGGGFTNNVLCLYTPEYSGLWAPLWAADPVGMRDVLFVAVICAFVAPTVWQLTSPCVPVLRAHGQRLRTHLRGRWTV
jgi:hypothetical protein